LDGPTGDPRDESIGDLVGRLLEDGRRYARAELDLAREIARHRAGQARNGFIALAVGVTLAMSALTALLLGVVLGLATLIGPLLSGLAVALVLAVAGYLLVRMGADRLRALSGDAEERAAIERGERQP
jgi:hypothetical protein